MFCDSKFKGDISSWDVSNVRDMAQMFINSKFNRDISNWNVSNVIYKQGMFKNCPINNKRDFKPKFIN
jgi:surface protein